MKIIHLTFLVLFFFTIPGFINGQSFKENEMVIIQGEKFILHQVRTGETIYSITRDFKIDSSQLLKHNPNISNGLNIGEILKVPFNENVLLSKLPAFKKGDPTSFINHTIESRSETAYSIAKQYGITVEEVYAYNPTVNSFKKGITLKIPQWEFNPEPEKVEAVISNQNTKNEDLIEHTVVSGETLYSIGKYYQVTESEILKYNPEAKNLKAGAKLVLPKKVADNSSSENISGGNNQLKYMKHTVEPGETIYGVTKKYNISEEELKELNPELRTAFRSGAVIRIPVKENFSDIQQTDNEVESTQPEALYSGTTPADCPTNSNFVENGPITVALFLPLFLEANNQLNKEFTAPEIDTLEQIEVLDETSSDTIVEEEKPVQLLKQFKGNSENFLQFYEGVLIAVDSIQKTGMKVILNVYDTNENPASVRKVVNSEAFGKTDLIIGPVYENVQKEVAQIAAINHIPLISPFTPKSGLINNNPQFYQVNPTREYLAEATVEMIAANYSNTNFIVVRTSAYEGTPEWQMVESIRKRFSNSGTHSGGRFTVYDFRKERATGLSKILLPEKENVVFIPTSDEGELSVAISNINNLARDFPITLIGAGNYQQKYPSIEIAHFHNLNFKYINPYWVDYKNNPTISFFEKFISNFGTEPNSYGVQGFDVAWYFLNAIHFYGKDFDNCLPYINTKLLQGNYYFKRVSPSGGFMNEGVSEISYNRNFEVVQKGVFGKPKY
ncbi:MAG TPA: LysM peptidoglycan-binding domain-containing protein [Draconibacterium sp.]|nr:LysM peptidoglycan-binding domain-containing protein [Draconibacterium sp.]